MGFSIIPRIRINSVLELTPEFLLDRGISLLMLDLDNTLAPYSGSAPSEEIFRWKERMNEAGVTLFIVSNTHTDRAKNFATLWGVPYVNSARKPRDIGISKALEQTGKTPAQSALAGDQLFTDVLGANLAGLCSIVVEPIELKNLFYILRYGIEVPFRICRRKEKIHYE
ncbi:MAG: YqeG family HAD IIIA-type phosphatase [Oscillospiraceae bacterium]|nr:YqeG family HAD IIIA-type phosphatase [Oscillospiraceae bacterium]